MADAKRRDEEEISSESIPGRSLAGASYGATEREQTRDVRRAHPLEDADEATGGIVRKIAEGEVPGAEPLESEETES